MKKVILHLAMSVFVVCWSLSALRAGDGADVPDEIAVDVIQDMRKETLSKLIHEKILHCRVEKGKQICALGDRWQYFSNLFVGLLMDGEASDEEIIWGMRNLALISYHDACAGVVFAEQIYTLGDWWEGHRPVLEPAVGFLIQMAKEPDAISNGPLYPPYAPAAKAVENLNLLREKYPDHLEAVEEIDKAMVTIAKGTGSSEVFGIANKAVIGIYGARIAQNVEIYREVQNPPLSVIPSDYVPPKVYTDQGSMIACPGQSLSSK